MKILHILDHSLPLHSGYTFRSNSIFQSQLQRGWHPVAITSSKYEENWKGDWAEKENREGITYYRTGNILPSRIPIVTERRLMQALSNRLKNIILEEKPDILHAHSPVLNAIPGLKIARKFGLPFVYEIRAFWEDAAVDHGTYKEHSWKYKIVRALETWVCRKANQVAVLCNGLKNDLIQRGISADKMTPVFNGVSPEDFKSCPPDQQYYEEWKLSGKKVIGFLGSFYHYEGLDLLLKAFRHVIDKEPDTRLLLVGGGPLEKELRQQTQDLQLSDKVIIPGRIPHDRVPGIYSFIDILAYPRYSMRLTELVTPLKPLEAMAMGKAIIASDVGGHKELIHHEETGLLFSAGNVELLAEGLLLLLRNQNLREKLQQTGKSWVLENHTWQRTTSVYENIYQKALEKKY